MDQKPYQITHNYYTINKYYGSKPKNTYRQPNKNSEKRRWNPKTVMENKQQQNNSKGKAKFYIEKLKNELKEARKLLAEKERLEQQSARMEVVPAAGHTSNPEPQPVYISKPMHDMVIN